jgi:hypothetical protein
MGGAPTSGPPPTSGQSPAPARLSSTPLISRPEPQTLTLPPRQAAYKTPGTSLLSPFWFVARGTARPEKFLVGLCPTCKLRRPISPPTVSPASPLPSYPLCPALALLPYPLPSPIRSRSSVATCDRSSPPPTPRRPRLLLATRRKPVPRPRFRDRRVVLKIVIPFLSSKTYRRVAGEWDQSRSSSEFFAGDSNPNPSSNRYFPFCFWPSDPDPMTLTDHLSEQVSDDLVRKNHIRSNAPRQWSERTGTIQRGCATCQAQVCPKSN